MAQRDNKPYPVTRAAYNAFGSNIRDELSKGNYAGAAGQVGRGALGMIGAVAADTYDSAAIPSEYIATAARTALTGDSTPVRIDRFSDALGRNRPQASAPAAQAPAASPVAQERSGPSNSLAPTPTDRMSALGYAGRDVQGAAGVTRFDKQGQSPIYTNVPGNTADWVEGGMRPGVNTIPSSAMSMAGQGRANEIQRGNTAMRDQQAFNRGEFLGGSGGIRRSDNQGDQFSMQRLMALPPKQRRDALAAMKMQQDEMLAGRGDQSAMERLMAQESGATARTRMGNETQLMNTDRLGANQRMNTDLAGQWGMAERGLANAGAYDVAGIGERRSALDTLGRILGNANLEPAEREDAMLMLLDQMSSQNRADGGLVYGMEDFESAMGYAQGGMVRGAGYGQTPQADAVLPEVNEYREYAMGAKQLGLPTIPFEQFLSLRAGARQKAVQQPEPVSFADGGLVHPRRAYVESLPKQQPYMGPTQGQPRYEAQQIPERPGRAPIPADRVPLGSGMLDGARSALRGVANRGMNFADGGQIPDPRDVSGRMVVDADPNAEVDSIPAVVDEMMPAKLDSGEFVIPTDVVQFFGTDKLNKMIAQARQGAQG